jgi:hypothetical protein
MKDGNYARKANPLNGNPSNKGKLSALFTRSKWPVLVLAVGIPLGLCLSPHGLFTAQILYGLVIQFPHFATPISDRNIEARSRSAQFAISYPSNWFYQETANNSRGDFVQAANISCISVFRLGVFVSLQRSSNTFYLLTDVAKQGEQFEDFEHARGEMSPRVASMHQTLSLREFAVDAEETFLREYTYSQSGSLGRGIMVRRCLSNYRLHNHQGYILQFCTDEDEFGRVAPTFLQMIESFEYLD